jgi:hypothetical protein
MRWEDAFELPERFTQPWVMTQWDEVLQGLSG